MQKIFLLFLLTSLCVNIALSQNGARIDTSSYPIKFAVNNIAKKGFKVQQLVIPDSTYELIERVTPQFQDADLFISAPLKKLRGNEFYKASFILVDQLTNDTIFPSSWEMDNNDRWLKKKNTKNEILWKNVTEDVISPESNYELIYILNKHERKVDCNCEYKFTALKHVPYAAAILAGGDMLRRSSNHFSDADKAFQNAQLAYDNYLSLWQNGAIESLITEKEFDDTGDEYKRGEELLKKRKNKARWGYSLLGSGIGGYLTHLIINKRKKKWLDKYCPRKTNSVEIKPEIGFSPNSTNHQMGINLTYTF